MRSTIPPVDLHRSRPDRLPRRQPGIRRVPTTRDATLRFDQRVPRLLIWSQTRRRAALALDELQVPLGITNQQIRPCATSRRLHRDLPAKHGLTTPLGRSNRPLNASLALQYRTDSTRSCFCGIQRAWELRRRARAVDRWRHRLVACVVGQGQGGRSGCGRSVVNARDGRYVVPAYRYSRARRGSGEHPSRRTTENRSDYEYRQDEQPSHDRDRRRHRQDPSSKTASWPLGSHPEGGSSIPSLRHGIPSAIHRLRQS
jgi:hypothetical protein